MLIFVVYIIIRRELEIYIIANFTLMMYCTSPLSLFYEIEHEISAKKSSRDIGATILLIQ